MLKLLIFDWDGTLCDSIARIAQSIRYAAAEVGLVSPSENDAKEIVGLGLTEALERLFPEIKRNQIVAMCESYSRYFSELDHNPSPFFAGAKTTLIELKEEGYFIAVATGKSRRGLDRVLKAHNMSHFFHSSRCADETAGKPDPKMINELLCEFGVSPEQALMVGDTEFDMAMAVKAGTPCLGVSYGAHAVDRLYQYKPIACIDHFPEVKKIIYGLNK